MRVKRRRLAGGAARMDTAAWRQLLDDGKVHLARALVVQEGASHFEVVEGGADVLVDIELQPSGVRCTARLGGLGGGPGRGFWAIPPVGAEVIVGVPDGELEAGPVIVACESTGDVPDGLGATTYVICVPAGGQLLVHDGTAGQAVPLATKADLDALAEVFANWVVAPTDGGAALKTLLTALIAGPPGWPAGTSVLKGK